MDNAGLCRDPVRIRAGWQTLGLSGFGRRSCSQRAESRVQHEGDDVGKEQKSTKEKRKPKADKKPAASAAPSPFSSVTATQKSGGGKKK